MAVRNKKQVIRSKKNVTRKIKKTKRVRRHSRTTAKSKVSILEKSGLIGCLTGTGVTSKNYKDFLFKA